MTIEGAPHLKTEHLRRSSTAPTAAAASASATCRPTSHIRMMARPSRSSRARSARRSTCPTTRTVEDVQEAYHLTLEARHQGQRPLPRRLQALQPLSSTSTTDDLTELLTGDVAEARSSRSPSGGREDHLPLPRQAPSPAAAPQGLHAKGGRRRPQGLHPPASTRTARWARSSSTCTRRVPPSAA